MGMSILLVGTILTTESDPTYSPQMHRVNFSSRPHADKAVLTFLYPYVASF
jgi:hypothetical protein